MYFFLHSLGGFLQPYLSLHKGQARPQVLSLGRMYGTQAVSSFLPSFFPPCLFPSLPFSFPPTISPSLPPSPPLLFPDATSCFCSPPVSVLGKGRPDFQKEHSERRKRFSLYLAQAPGTETENESLSLTAGAERRWRGRPLPPAGQQDREPL